MREEKNATRWHLNWIPNGCHSLGLLSDWNRPHYRVSIYWLLVSVRVEMSAYGPVVKPASPSLPPSVWPLEGYHGTSDATLRPTHLTVYHLTLALVTDGLSDLISQLHIWFADEVRQGLTYPQEGEIRRDAFEAYFFSADVFVAIIGGDDDGILSATARGETDASLERARCGRPWDTCVAGFYYVSLIQT